MLFLTFDPYFDEINDLSFCNDCNDCLFCMDEKNVININDQFSFIKKCSCKYYIHIECMEKWYSIKKICPICNSSSIEKNENLIFKQQVKKKIFMEKIKKKVVNGMALIVLLIYFCILLNHIFIILYLIKAHPMYRD
jgi:hypothetical protein